MSVQNSCRSLRVATGGRPGDRNGGRPHRSDRRFFLSIATFSIEVLRRPLESAQYTSIEFGNRCRKAGVRPSMGSVGDCYDNAMAESFFATLECELLDRSRFKTHSDARNAVFDFIEGFYNPQRRHSSLGYVSPAAFERHHRACAASPGALDPAVVLGALKAKPSRAREVRGLDRPSARRRVECAGRDGRMGSAGAEQKDATSRQEEQKRKDTMNSDSVA